MATLLSQGARALGLFAAVVLVAGCGQQPPAGDGFGPDKEKAVAQKAGADGAPKEKKAHDHSGWWCDEHGVPEHECSMCSAKVAKQSKAAGDWCDAHERAKSQCFICDPKLKEKYAARYRTKYGKEPPPVEEEKKDDGKK